MRRADHEGGLTVPYESPAVLLARLRLGREEFCQRLLTSLILGGPYPKWNARSRPAPEGLRFLEAVHGVCFGPPWPGNDLLFIDEFELPARSDTEPGRCPDYGVLWDDHVWIVELKTEKASHRPDQIPGYYELAHHHYPNAAVDLLYLTGPMTAPYEPAVPGDRYAHLTWGDLTAILREIWPAGTSAAQDAVLDGLHDAIDHLDQSPSVWRQATYGDQAPPPASVPAVTALDAPDEEPSTDALGRALQLARATSTDGVQRALDVMPNDLAELHLLRMRTREHLAASPPGSPLRHVAPWLWRPESTGRAMTAAGAELGFELRFSRYRKPQY